MTNPLAGLVNLFDLWIVVVVALILVLANSTSSQLRKDQQTASDPHNQQDLVPIPSFRESNSELTGKGTRWEPPIGLKTAKSFTLQIAERIRRELGTFRLSRIPKKKNTTALTSPNKSRPPTSIMRVPPMHSLSHLGLLFWPLFIICGVLSNSWPR